MCYRNTSFLMYLNTSKSCLILCDPMDCFSQTSLSFTNPGVCTNSHPLSWWGYPTISSSVSPFSCPQPFPASGIFPVSQLFTSGGQILELHCQSFQWIQGWFPLGLTDIISLHSKRLSSVFSSTIIWKHQFFGTQPFLWSNSHICTWQLENCSYDCTDL